MLVAGFTADDWLRTMEKKLDIAHVDEQDKVPFATHYLEGPANMWWDNQKACHILKIRP